MSATCTTVGRIRRRRSGGGGKERGDRSALPEVGSGGGAVAVSVVGDSDGAVAAAERSAAADSYLRRLDPAAERR